MLFFFAFACNNEKGFSDSYAITITASDVTDDGVASTCTDDTTGFRDTFFYDVSYFGSTIEIIGSGSANSPPPGQGQQGQTEHRL